MAGREHSVDRQLVAAAHSTYLKVPFELSGDAPRRAVELPAGGCFVAADRATLVSVMADVLASSLDAADVDAVRNHGAAVAVSRLLDMADAAFRWEAQWWQVLAIHGDPAGCVLPVLYRRSERRGENEGTIYHMGVRPDYRGQHFGQLLLAQATNTLLALGVWRLYCDTASNNQPMLRAFTEQGWTQHPAYSASLWA